MDPNLEKQFSELAEEYRFEEIVNIIEQIPEEERDFETIGWYVRSLNNSEQLNRAVEVSMQYREQGADDALWHYRLGYAYLYLNREDEAENELLRALELAEGEENLTEWVNELLQEIAERKAINSSWNLLSRDFGMIPIIP